MRDWPSTFYCFQNRCTPRGPPKGGASAFLTPPEKKVSKRSLEVIKVPPATALRPRASLSLMQILASFKRFFFARIASFWQLFCFSKREGWHSCQLPWEWICAIFSLLFLCLWVFFCLASINHSKSAIRNEIFANIYIIQTLKAFVDGIDFEGDGGGSHRSRTWMASDLEVLFFVSLFDEIGLNYGPGSVVFGCTTHTG